MRKLFSSISISLLLISCGTDDNQDTNLGNPELVMDTDNSTDIGELRMIEVMYTSGDASPSIELQKIYFENDKPLLDTLWRSNGSLGYVTTYEYTTDDKLINQTQIFYDSSQNDRIDTREFTYDNQGRIIRRLDVEYKGTSNEFTQNVHYTYNGSTIEIGDNFSNNSVWTLDSNNRVLRDESSTGTVIQATYSGSNLIVLETNYNPEERYEFNLDTSAQLIGGFNYETILANNSINTLIFQGGGIADGGYEVFQENYLTSFTYSYLLNGSTETQTVQYSYDFDSQGRLKKRTEDSEFYPARELVDYEYFYNE